MKRKTTEALISEVINNRLLFKYLIVAPNALRRVNSFNDRSLKNVSNVDRHSETPVDLSRMEKNADLGLIKYLKNDK